MQSELKMTGQTSEKSDDDCIVAASLMNQSAANLKLVQTGASESNDLENSAGVQVQRARFNAMILFATGYCVTLVAALSCLAIFLK
jgi:hypothetical protein